MAHLVMSTDIDPVNVQAFGNWFSFKPGQVRSMDPRFVDFLTMDKRHMGFVALPDVCAEDPTCEEAVAAKAAAIEEGRRNIIADLEKLKYNLEVSLQKDYDMAGIKTTSLHMEGKAHIPVYKRLAAFKQIENENAQSAVDEINKLKGVINGDPASTNAVEADKRSSNLSKSERLSK